MEVATRLADLNSMHPRLLWDDIIASVVAVLGESRFRVDLEMQSIPGFDEDLLRLEIDAVGVSELRVGRLRRTYETARLIELASIAIAGLELYYGGGHEIRDIARLFGTRFAQ